MTTDNNRPILHFKKVDFSVGTQKPSTRNLVPGIILLETSEGGALLAAVARGYLAAWYTTEQYSYSKIQSFVIAPLPAEKLLAQEV